MDRRGVGKLSSGILGAIGYINRERTIDSKPKRVKFPKAGPATLHYRGGDWATAMCGAVRRRGHLILTIGADCPKCLSIAATKPQEASHGVRGPGDGEGDEWGSEEDEWSDSDSDLPGGGDRGRVGGVELISQ